MLSSGCCKKPVNPFDDKDYTPETGRFKDTRDGKIYNWVKIDDRIWMAENLNYTGEDIKHITDNTEWINNIANDGWCYYGNSDSLGAIYGALYQWEAAKKACPEGWHLPSDEDWIKLEQLIDNDQYALNASTTLKSSTGWDWEAGSILKRKNRYGFSALPGGYRSLISDAYFLLGGYSGFWWNIEVNNIDEANYCSLVSQKHNIFIDYADKKNGFSVRCIKD